MGGGVDGAWLVLIEHDLYSGGAEHIRSVRKGFEGIEECSEVGEDLECEEGSENGEEGSETGD